MRCFMMLLGLKTVTRRGGIGTSRPVLGLRPTRSPLSRTMNDPNDESFTVSPAMIASQISLRTISTIPADSVLDRPRRLYTASARSARVTVLPPITPAARIILDLSSKSWAKPMRAGRAGQHERINLPAQQRRAPGEAAAHRFQHDEVALLYTAVMHRRIEGERDGGRRSVAVPRHGGNHLVLRNSELFGAGVDDALVGLVRHEPVDVVRPGSGRLESRVDDVGDHADGMLEHLAPLHPHMPDSARRGWPAVDEELFLVLSVGPQVGGEEAAVLRPAGALTRLHDNGAGPVAGQDAGRTVVPVQDTGEGLRPDHQSALPLSRSDQRVGGRERIDEAGAHRLDIEGGAVTHAELVLHG